LDADYIQTEQKRLKQLPGHRVENSGWRKDMQVGIRKVSLTFFQQII